MSKLEYDKFKYFNCPLFVLETVLYIAICNCNKPHPLIGHAAAIIPGSLGRLCRFVHAFGRIPRHEQKLKNP